MRTAELLNAMAAWLASPNNEAMLLAEGDEKCLQVVAESCVLASELLKKAAEEVDALEPPDVSLLTPETIAETAAFATVLDQSNDPQLQKMASVLDELLLTIAAPPGAMAEKKAAENQRLEDLRKKYNKPREMLREYHKLGDAEKAIDKSNMVKEYRILEQPLNTRYCPDHAGVPLQRISDGVWACETTHKQYNFATGYTLDNGDKVPGGEVSQQTMGPSMPYHSLFDNREGRLGSHH
jgi:hypothetical protein